MKKYIVFLFLSISTYYISAQETETTTYFLIRHAEKDRTDSTNKNPDLTEKGKKRAIYWSEVLASIKFDAVYSTNYNRTIQTAEPTANSNNLEIQFYNPRNLFNTEFQNDTKGKTVLIVGHSNTTPMFVNKILGEEKYPEIDDSNNANLYIITISENKKSAVLLNIKNY